MVRPQDFKFFTYVLVFYGEEYKSGLVLGQKRLYNLSSNLPKSHGRLLGQRAVFRLIQGQLIHKEVHTGNGVEALVPGYCERAHYLLVYVLKRVRILKGCVQILIKADPLFPGHYQPSCVRACLRASS